MRTLFRPILAAALLASPATIAQGDTGRRALVRTIGDMRGTVRATDDRIVRIGPAR